jgi:hypothetical protein
LRAISESEQQAVDELNFFAYLFDTGEIFERGYSAADDRDPQQGPLQRGFSEAFQRRKEPRLGEEMARALKLNPTSEYLPTHPTTCLPPPSSV